MLYSTIFSLIEREGCSASFSVPSEWKQGRAVFGGLQGALCVNVMRQVMAQSLPLRSFQMTFIAPLAGDRITMRAEVLREGRNTVHVEARLLEETTVLATATGVFGVHRPSAVSVLPEIGAVPGGQSVPSQYVPGVSPTFLQHFRSVWKCCRKVGDTPGTYCSISGQSGCRENFRALVP